MRKTFLTIGLYASIFFSGFAQTSKLVSNPNYKPKKLRLEEINLVSGYYQQDGNNSAVTGGIGSEYLYDVANSIDIKFSKIDKFNRIHTLNTEISVDYYSSASSDKIDPITVSSASSNDIHFYPTISYNLKDDISRSNKGLSLSYSTEWDYKSIGINLNYSKLSKDLNKEFSLKGGAFFDTWMAILPVELRPIDYSSGADGDQENLKFKPRNSYNIAFSGSQVINQQLQILVTVEPSFQEGLLSTPYHRVYFLNGTHTVEKLPGERFKLPIALRASYFLGDKIIIKGFYRFYNDSWGMQAHTANLEVPIKITPFISFSPFLRINTQTAVKYFNEYAKADNIDSYYTSDFDISSFRSGFIGSGLRFAPPGGIYSKHINSLELRYGHYSRSSGLKGNSVSLHIKLK